jgi:hypothetical protein
MTEVGRFFDAASYTEADQAEVQNRFRREGVLPSIGVELFVFAPGGMFVSVSSGEAMVEGFWYKNDASLSLAVATNTSGSTRIDRVILRLNRVSNSLNAAILQGTPGAGAPALTQIVGGIWEFPLATITIPTATTGAITTGMITDARVFSQQITSTKEIATGGLIGKIQLSFQGTSDNPNGSSISSMTTVLPNNNFTVDDANSIFIFTVRMSCLLAYLAAPSEVASWLYLDSGATTYKLDGGAIPNISGTYDSIGGGVVFVTGLSVGVHIANVSLSANSAVSAYCRQASQPLIEWCHIQALELKR